MKSIDAEYYGYRDEDDGILEPLEQEHEKKGMQDSKSNMNNHWVLLEISCVDTRVSLWPLMWTEVTLNYSRSDNIFYLACVLLHGDVL